MVSQYYATSSNQGLNLSWLSHTTSAFPSNNQWTVSGIYLDAGTLEAEVYEPNIFNPSEEMIVKLIIIPAIPSNTDNLVTIGVTNGVTLAAPFSR